MSDPDPFVCPNCEKDCWFVDADLDGYVMCPDCKTLWRPEELARR